MPTTLPGSEPTALPTPELPATSGPRAVVPMDWNQTPRIMAAVLDLFDKKGQEAADNLIHWINQENAK